MSSLRQRLRNPWIYLCLAALLWAAALADAMRPPQEQLTARAYLSMVEAYQTHASPLLSARIQCRYRPSCSRYSAAAVRRHGVLEGLRLTTARLWRCREAVPFGTPDPVPGD